MEQPILIIDAMNMLFRAAHTTGFLTLSDGTPCGAAYGFIRSTIASYRATIGKTGGKVYVVWDGGRSPRRLKIFPEYKGARREKPRPDDLKAQLRQAERQIMFDQVPTVQQLLSCLGITQFQREGVEADDIISALAKTLSGESRIIILSSDADFRQLVNSNTTLVLGNDCVIRAEDVPYPEEEVTVKAICGCNSDGIPGLPNIGDITARRLLDWIRSDTGENRPVFLPDLPRTGDETFNRVKPFGRVKTALNAIKKNGMEIPERNAKLVDLEKPLEWEEVWEAATAPWLSKPDLKTYRQELTAMRWHSLLGEFDQAENIAFQAPYTPPQGRHKT